MKMTPRESCWRHLLLVGLSGVLMLGIGCSSSGSLDWFIKSITWPKNQSVYVSQEVAVDSFPISSSLAQNGNVSPATALTGINTTFNDTHRTAFDSSGRMYETDISTGTVDIFPAGASGNVAPTASIDLDCPSGIAIVASNNVFVSSCDNVIYVYPAVASGTTGTLSTSPTYSIEGANTTFKFPNGIALNSTDTELWVANEENHDVLCFTLPSSGTTGTQNLTPKATITNTAFLRVHSLALDSSNNVYVTNTNTNAAGDSGVYVYPSTATGAATPSATIVGSSTGFFNPNGISLDSENNIYVGNNGTTAEVLIFRAGANGNVAPVATIGGSGTGINFVHGVTVGPTP